MKKKRRKLVPLNIPAGMNLYDEIVELAKSGEMGEPQIRFIVQAIDETLDEFDIPPDKRRKVGDLIQRFSMLISIQEEGEAFQIPGDHPELNAIVDIYEAFARRAAKLMGE